MSFFVEFDVAEYAESHKKDKGRVEKDQPRLANVRVIEENETGSKDTSRKGIAGFPHNQENDGNSQGAQQGWKSSEGDIWDLVLNVRVTDVVEEKMAVKANKPTDEGEQQLRKGRVDIEEVDSLQIIGGEL